MHGESISRIARRSDMPSRDSIRRHVLHGHLAPDIAEQVARSHGLDSAAVAQRIADVAQRAREAGLEALEAGDRAGVLRAGDAELRALSALSGLGVELERDAFVADGVRDIARAVFVLARSNPAVAEAVAVQLDSMGRTELAEDLLEQIPETKTREVAS